MVTVKEVKEIPCPMSHRGGWSACAIKVRDTLQGGHDAGHVLKLDIRLRVNLQRKFCVVFSIFECDFVNDTLLDSFYHAATTELPFTISLIR